MKSIHVENIYFFKKSKKKSSTLRFDVMLKVYSYC